MGLIYKYTGKYDKALEANQLALQIRLKVLGPISRGVANCYHNIGSVYQEKGEIEKSLEYHQRALAVRRQALGEVHLDVAISYFNLANLYDKKGEYDKSLEYYQKAFELWQKTQRGVHSDVATTYHNIGGGLYYKKGDYDKALAFYQQGLQLRRQTLGEVHADVADSYISIGRVYYRKKDYDQALTNYQQALRIRRQLFGEINTEVAETYSNIGGVLRAKGAYAQALANHQLALQIKSRFYGRHHPGVATSLNSIGEIHRMTGDYPQALRHFQQAILANIPAFSDSLISHNPVLTNETDSYLESKALFNSLQGKAACLEKRYRQSLAPDNLLLAYRTYCAIDTLARQIHRTYAGERDQVAFSAKAMLAYQQALPLCLELYALTRQALYLNQAFSFAERGKASVLASTLAESKARTFAGIPDSLLQQDQGLRARIAHYAQKIAEELARGPGLDSSKLNDYHSQLFAVHRQQESLVSGLEKNFPHYFSLKYQPTTVTPSQLQAVLNDQTAVLEYVLTDSLLHLFTLTRRGFAARTLVLDSLFRRQLLAFREATLARDEDLYLQVGYRLYRLLIPPNLPRAIRQLVVIPGEELATLPFEALPRRNRLPKPGKSHTYLLHQYAVSYAYSARLLYERLAQAGAADSPRLLALAPVFADTQTRLANVTSRQILSNRPPGVMPNAVGPETDNPATRDFTPIYRGRKEEADPATTQSLLPGWLSDSQYVAPLLASEQEVETIARLFHRKNAPARVYLHEQAREELLKGQDLSAYTYLHLATHGFVNERFPELSGILLAQDSASAEDGILYTGEIYNLRLPADLVTLSACETGLGRIAPGEGVIGLTRALLYAGAQNVVVSFWKVSDASTADLMGPFYQGLLEGQDKAQALRAAKLALIRQGKYDQPFYWAPFILVGK
jgi:CHAT domain-containing protein/tetratricopeptide (TPR) repeat protein